VDKQNTQEANVLFQLIQCYTLHKGTIRHATAPDLASTDELASHKKPHIHQHTTGLEHACTSDQASAQL
jgi:hypothetical protein